MSGASSGRMGSRAGLSLVELLVVMVIAGVVVGATYQVLNTNQRVHTSQQERAQAQGTLRAGLDVLSNELRGISIAEGDLVSMGEHRIEVRVPQAMALLCDWEEGDQRNLTILPLGRAFREDERVTVFAQNDLDTQSDDQWLATGGSRIDHASDTSTPSECASFAAGTGEAQYVEIGGLGELIQANDLARGAPIRTFETFEYGLFESDGESYLGRRNVDGDGEEHRLAGPVESSDGVRFEYLQADGSEASQSDDVERIRVTIQAVRRATGSPGDSGESSLTMTIQPRD